MKNIKVKGKRPGFQLVPDKNAPENKDLRKETSIQKQIREMKEKHAKETGQKEGEPAMIEELDSKEFQLELEQGLVMPKYTLLESSNFNIGDTFYDPSANAILKFKRPEHLNLEVWLPRVSKLGEIDLEVSIKKVIIDVKEM